MTIILPTNTTVPGNELNIPLTAIHLSPICVHACGFRGQGSGFKGNLRRFRSVGCSPNAATDRAFKGYAHRPVRDQGRMYYLVRIQTKPLNDRYLVTVVVQCTEDVSDRCLNLWVPSTAAISRLLCLPCGRDRGLQIRSCAYHPIWVGRCSYDTKPIPKFVQPNRVVPRRRILVEAVVPFRCPHLGKGFPKRLARAKIHDDGMVVVVKHDV